ncbi:MAG: EF-hand domain-containing protein [Pseudomonas sp.]
MSSADLRSRWPALLWLPLALVLARPAAAQVADTDDYLRRIDRDGDGRIGLDEYLDWMSHGFDQRDRDHDGVLDATELPGGRGNPVTRARHRAALAERFSRQDADGDGYLSARELQAPPR